MANRAECSMKATDKLVNPADRQGHGLRRQNGWQRALHNPLVRAGVVLGAGFGGMADGIVLHSILGWHHMICYTMDCQPLSVAQLQQENTQDGYFLLVVWLMVLTGTAMLFKAASQLGPTASGRVLLGAMLAGSGAFNFIEGLINHQILGLH